MDGTSYWVESLEDQPELTADEARRELEVEVSTLKRELAEVRKELAAKTVQLSKRDQSDKAAQEKWAEQRAGELAAAAAAPKDQRIAALEQSVLQLEVALAQKSEELDEARRLYSSQKRALKDALSAAAEREAADAAAGEAGLEAATAAAEEEVERLLQEVAQLKTRSALELQAKEAELAELKQRLALHEHDKVAAVAAAEAAAAVETEEQLAAATQDLEAQVADLRSEVTRLRNSAQSYLREEREDMAENLADINKQKVQLQREFDAFKDLTAQTHRQHREEQARLLEENAALKARIAAEAARVAMGGLPGAGVGRPGPKTFAAVGDPDSVGGFLEHWLGRVERQRRGLVPVLVIASLMLLVLLIAVVRAAASARGEHKGAICFLSKLGIQIGEGCGSSLGSHATKTAVAEALGQLVEVTPRIKDIEPSGSVKPAASSIEQRGSSGSTDAGGAAVTIGAAGRRRTWRKLTQLWHTNNYLHAAA